MLEDFINQFTQTPLFYKKINNRYFLENKRLIKLEISELNPELFGCFLGEIKNATFYPSFNLLDILAENSKEKVFVNDIGEIDFLYGKHLRKRHVTKILGSRQKNVLKLVQNEYDENIGYGVFTGFSKNKKQILRHILDRGFFIKIDKNRPMS
jgi:ribosome biogenesis protein Nip4